MSKLKKIYSSIWPALFWSALIFVLLVIPGGNFPSGGFFSIPNLDKIIHIILFGTLVWLWIMYFRYNSKEKSSIIIKIVILACMYGIGMEFVQKYFVPGRSFDLFDIVADCVGSIIAGLLLMFIVKTSRTGSL